MESNNSNRLVVGLALLMLILIGGLIWLWNSKNQLKEEAEQLIAQKNIQIQQASKQLDIFEGKTLQLDSLILVQRGELAGQSRMIDSLIKSGKITQGSLYRARRESRKLEDLSSVYLRQIDSLIEATKVLVAEKQAISESFEAEKVRSSKLMDENTRLYTTVEKGKILKAESIVLAGVRYRNNGKELESNRSSKVEKIKACIKLLENRMAEKGAKDILLRLISPNGSTLYFEEAGSGKFMIQGVETLYTKRKTVNYQNNEMETCILYEQGSPYVSGTYTAEIYADAELIGTGTFSLK